MKTWLAVFFSRKKKDKVIRQLVKALSSENGYKHMTLENIYVEQCALSGLEINS